MYEYFTKYATVDVTPSSTTILTCNNTLNEVPKYIHIKCDSESDVYTTLKGYNREMWLIPEYGFAYLTNGSTGALAFYAYTPDSTTPTATNKFYITSSTIEIYKGAGSITGLWHTGSTYKVHLYA